MDFSLSVSESLRESDGYRGACRIIKKLRDERFSAYLVGGAPRDIFLGKMPDDYDIATSARLEDMLRLFPKAYPIGASFGIVTVLEGSHSYELASFREERDYMDGRHPETVRYTDNPELDAIRRDFTINALFYDPLSEKLIDYVGGIGDLKRGILRTVGDPYQRFSEDYLRIMRAVRFAVRFRYELDSETKAAIRKFAPELTKISMERIRDELGKMLTGAYPAVSVQMLSELGILSVILPEIEALRGLEQPPLYHPEGDVFEHTMLMLEHIAVPNEEIAWCILLHDTGKNGTQSFDEDGIPHFYGHETLGTEIAEKILRRFRMPKQSIENICAAVRNHMRFAHIDKMKEAKWKRLMSDSNFPLELELHRIDCTASHGIMNNYVLMLDRMNDLSKSNSSTSLPKAFLNGNDLLKLGMKPGPEMGKLLNLLMDMQLEARITSREEALEFAKNEIAE